MSDRVLRFDHVHVISKAPEPSANWYAEMFYTEMFCATMVTRGAGRIFVDLGGRTRGLRGQRSSNPAATAIPHYADFLSHNAWSTDDSGVLRRDLERFCAELHSKGISCPIELKRGVGRPDSMSIELMEWRCETPA